MSHCLPINSINEAENTTADLQDNLLKTWNDCGDLVEF